MKKFLSIVTSGTLALLMATTSVVTSFAYDGNDDSAKATDAVSLEVVSDNTIPAEEPTVLMKQFRLFLVSRQLTIRKSADFQILPRALKLAGILIPVQLNTEYMFLTESHGTVWARVQPLTLRITH